MGFSGVRKSISFRSLLIHLLCEVLPEMPDLCRVGERLHFNLPDFWLVKTFYTRLSPKYPGISKVGKTILIIGKTGRLLYSRTDQFAFINSFSYKLFLLLSKFDLENPLSNSAVYVFDGLFIYTIKKLHPF